MGTTFCGMVPRETFCLKSDNPAEDERKNIIINYYCEQSITNKINVTKRAESVDFSKGGERVWDNDIIKIRNMSLNNHPLLFNGHLNKKIKI